MSPAIAGVKRSGGSFYLGMAIATAVIALAGFVPSILDPTGRKAPLTWAVAAHGLLFSAWLLLLIA